MRMTRTFLIIEARFYEDIADELVRGAIAALEAAGARHERIAVPGVLEIPAALAIAADGRPDLAGYVLLGCVIRGETTHYDIVANESARAVMDLAVSRRLAVGNGILTVENDDQAWARAALGKGDKGAMAARAAIAMADLKAHFAKPRG
jgi:6,7-dimethyl-8-ribityllumazine synthase